VTLSGTVRERVPNVVGDPIPGAEIRVGYKGGPGPVAVSDAEGRYALVGIESSAFKLDLTKDGYEPTTQLVAQPTEDTTLDLSLPPVLHTLSGVVTETPPTVSTPVVNATVEIASGSNRGQVVKTDGNGSYTMTGVWGEFDILLSRIGYESTRVHAAARSSVNRLDVRMMPDDQPTTTVFAGGLCADFAWWFPREAPWMRLCVAYPLQTHHFLPIHRPGPIALRFTWEYQEDYSAEFAYLEVQCGQRKAEQKYTLGPQGPPIRIDRPGPGPMQIFAAEAAICEIKPSRYRSFKGQAAATTYHIDVLHPK
jgi:hypothetical protein